MKFRRLVQSPYLHLQAVGSDGSDGIPEGILLRWDLLGDLGDSHLPKGNLAAPFGPYPTKIGYNKLADFVFLFRAPYSERYQIEVDLTAEIPDRIHETGLYRDWVFEGRFTPGGVHDVRLRFENAQLYDEIRASVDPAVDSYLFLRRYRGVLSAGLEGDLFFAFEGRITAHSPAKGEARIEVLSRYPRADDPEPFVSCRKLQEIPRHLVTDPPQRPARIGVLTPRSETVRLVAENAYAARLQCRFCSPSVLRFEPYEDFRAMVRELGSATWVGAFSLSVDDTVVLGRLEDAARFRIDTWPRFNDGSTVVRANYEDKWRSPGGLKEAVSEYLELSRTDPRAEKALPADPADDSGELVLSHLDALRLIAQDFHAARMLGLGHIDTQGIEERTQQYIYAAIYLTRTRVDGKTVLTEHVFLSLPTSMLDRRPPLAPVLDRLEYGLTTGSSTEERSLTDADGYAPYADERIVQLVKEPFPYDYAARPFFAEADEFCLSDLSRPLLLGVDYRGQGEGSWRQPELSHDPDYLDNLGMAESVVFPERAPEPAFLHKETEEGAHEYAIYGVDRFARPTDRSNVLATDATGFPKRNTLLAPHNLAAQYIQQEDPVLLTSSAEQQLLADREAANPGGDNEFVRLGFDWSHAHNIAYQRGELVEVFFRQELPRTVQGEIKSVSTLSGNRVEVRTESYENASKSPPETVTPEISVGEEGRFAGSVFVSERRRFYVSQVRQSTVSGEGPIFILQQIRQEEAEDPDLENRFTTVVSYVSPSAGERFTAVENLADPGNWTQLAATIDLVHFSGHTESETLADGSNRVLTVGGIYETATVTAVEDVDGDGQPIAGSESGVYRVEFDSYVLPDHPGADTDWHGGVARLPDGSGTTTAVTVWKIVADDSGRPLEIWVHHPGFADRPLQTGSGIDVNFHPGYRTYLYAESGVFDRATLYPAAGQRSRTTLLAVRAVDRTPDPDNASPLSPPLTVLAREALELASTGTPAGPSFATRPDVDGKATYTFDTEVDTSGGRQPYALVFSRTNDRALLDALYEPETVETILESLPDRGDDAWFTTRWHELANAELDASGSFTSYEGYAFPDPDKSGLLDGSESATEEQQTILEATRGTLTPLTERPVVFQQLAAGRQTRGTAPVLRDADGELLAPDDAEFDPFPMATTYTESGTTWVRFTDYTLDGASRNVFFYASAEIDDALQRGAPSEIAGPIQTVDTSPPPAPVIRSVHSQVAGLGTDDVARETQVTVRVNPYLPSEGISSLVLYRATEAGEVLTVRTMTEVESFAPEEDLVDTFADLDTPPYGRPLYYRVVARRAITNERGDPEHVPSIPSRPALANVVDVERPEAPDLSAIAGTETPAELRDVVLSWEKTSSYGTYLLYKLNDRGNWVQFYAVTSDEETLQYPPDDDFTTYPETELLPKADEAGSEIFHHFRIRAINASGMPSATDGSLTI